MQASTPEKTDQIAASSGSCIEAECMCSCEKSVRILSTISLNSEDDRPTIKYGVLNSEVDMIYYSHACMLILSSVSFRFYMQHNIS